MYNTLKGSVCNFIDEMKNVGREREREREREGEGGRGRESSPVLSMELERQ